MGIRRLPRNAIAGALGLLALAALVGAFFSGSRFSAAEIVFDNLSEIQTLDPATANGQKENRILIFLFEGLAVADPKTLDPLPGVAKSWEVSPDGKTYTFRLRESARWSNGDPVTAEDFVYSWRRVLHPATGCDFPYLLGKVIDAEKFLNPDRLEPGDPVLVTMRDRREIRGTLRAHRLRGRLTLLPDRQDISFEAEKRDDRGWTLSLANGNLRSASRIPPRRDDPVEIEIDGVLRKGKGSGFEEAGVSIQTENGAISLEEYESVTLVPERLGLHAPDPRTFVVSFTHPVPYFLQTTYLWPLLPVHAPSIESWKRRAPDRWRFEWIRPENLVGNGPYRILERRVNDRFLFEKNPHYWDEENVRIRRIDAIAVESATTRLNLFEAGLVDWTQQIPISVIPDLIERDRKAGNSAREFRNDPLLSIYWYYLNVTKPPLDDRRVRMALAKAIDRERITKFVTRAGQTPANSLVPPLIPGYEPAQGQEFDPVAARAMLAQAGFPEGQGFPVLEILYNTDEMHRDIAEIVQDEWRRHLGIEIKLLNQEWKSYLDAQITHNYSISRGSWIADYRDPNTFLEIYMTGNGNNRTGFSDSEFDALMRRASEEGDHTRRFAMLREAEEIVLREAPAIPLFYYVGTNLVKPRLRGWEHNALDMHFPKFWSLEKKGDSPLFR